MATATTTEAKAAPAPLTASPYPFAAAPDIIRAQQKDAYFQGVLTNQLADLHRRFLGARSAHAWTAETRTAADLLYLGLTTLLGNRTLGEEYCDLVQVEAPAITRRQTSLQKEHGLDDKLVQPVPEPSEQQNGSSFVGPGPRLPSLGRRAGYICASILMPYLAGRLLPSFRAIVRARLQNRLAALLARRGKGGKAAGGGGGGVDATPGLEYRVGRYILTHLGALTSGAHVHALVLAVFYFGGAYYSLPKRLLGLRYVFTRRLPETPVGSGGAGDRAGYEVLGVLLVVQMVVRGWLHVRAQLTAAAAPASAEEAIVEAAIRERAFGDRSSVSLDENAYSSNNELLVEMGAYGDAGAGGQRSLAEIGAATHTPVVQGGRRPRYDLGAGEEVMAWIRGRQQRKCTLCLEGMRDPAATQCGHVFCWACIGDWVREKPECPLCRRQILVQHILPLRAAC